MRTRLWHRLAEPGPITMYDGSREHEVPRRLPLLEALDCKSVHASTSRCAKPAVQQFQTMPLRSIQLTTFSALGAFLDPPS